MAKRRKSAPARSAGLMTLPEGFRAQLVAGEPTLIKPIAMTTDERGRLWVVESRTYPHWIKDKRPGKDRILILEADGKGGYACKVFLDNGRNLSGIAIGHGGVSILVVPGDLLHRAAEHPTGESAPVTGRGIVMPPDDQVRALADRLNAAERVTLFCGAGVQGAHDAVMALARKLHSPVGHSLRGKEWIQYGNPYDVGMSGLLGYGACYDATH